MCESVSACVLVMDESTHTELLKSPRCWCLCRFTLTAHDSWRNSRFACLFVFFMPVFACGCRRRGAMEPVVMWRGEDDNHSGRLNNSDQHCDHPSLGMEQLHLRRRPQAEVPLLPGAEEHHRLSEVHHLMNTLGTSTPRWTTSAITSSVERAHSVNSCLWGICNAGVIHHKSKHKTVFV